MQSTAPTAQPDLVKPNTSVPNHEPDQVIAELARQLADCRPRRTSFAIPARLKQFLRFFQACYEYFEETNKAQVSTSQTSEWLMDNFYIVEQAIRQVEQDLPVDYYQRLPKTRDGWARIYIIALANTKREDTRLEIEQIQHFLQIFQEITPLNTGELWALPLMLRLTVLESLAESLATVTKLKWDAASQPDLGILAFDAPHVDPDTIVANSILSLRLLGTQDWKTFFESVSVLEKNLRRDPSGIYAQMDFETRNDYRSVVEDLASGSVLEEAEIAMQAIQLTQTGSSAREQHVGYYLIAQGKETLEAQIKFRPSVSQAIVRIIQRNATAFYLGGIGLLTFLACFLIVLYTSRTGGTLFNLIAAGMLSLLPASSVAIDLINGLVISLIPPRTPPKLDFENGVPEEYRTMVVIPALLGTERDAPFLLSQIERHFIGNSDSNIFFALITDLADAPEK
jgi:cyclic beta-1,2-glucan synthetase